MNKHLPAIVGFVLLSLRVQGNVATNLATSATVVVPKATPDNYLSSFSFSIGSRDSVENAVSNLVACLLSIAANDGSQPYFETTNNYFVFTGKSLEKTLPETQLRIAADFPISSADVFGAIVEMIATCPGLTMFRCGNAHIVATSADHYAESLIMIHGTIPSSVSIDRLHIRFSGKTAGNKPRHCEFHKTSDTTYIGIIPIAYYKQNVYIGDRVFCEEGNYADADITLALYCDDKIVAEEPIHVPMLDPFVTIDISDTEMASRPQTGTESQ